MRVTQIEKLRALLTEARNLLFPEWRVLTTEGAYLRRRIDEALAEPVVDYQRERDEARANAIQFDLDCAGIEQRAAEAAELVDLRAELEGALGVLSDVYESQNAACVGPIISENNPAPCGKCLWCRVRTAIRKRAPVAAGPALGRDSLALRGCRPRHAAGNGGGAVSACGNCGRDDCEGYESCTIAALQRDLDTARNERIEARKERDEALGKVKALEKMLDYQMDHTNGWSRRALETEAEIADAMEAARIRGASVLDVNGKPKALVVLVSDIMHDLIGKRAVARDVHEVLDRTRGERDEARKRLEQQTDWYQQRFNRLRKWVKEEVEPLSKEVAHRYFSICANGSPAPHESADWTDTMHGLKLRAEQAEKQRDEALFKLAEAKSDIRMLRAHLEAITTEFEATVAHADWRAAGSKGMSVPYHGDFASAVQLPSVISRMRTWAKGFREVLEKTK